MRRSIERLEKCWKKGVMATVDDKRIGFIAQRNMKKK
jgi:hypothetical protein